MQVIADLCVIPFGHTLSLANDIATCQRILREAGLQTQLHAYGTNIEGEWDAVMAAIKRCHEALHANGAPRISTTLKLGTRTDKPQSLEGKVRSVEAALAAGA